MDKQDMQRTVERLLFETGAIRVAPEDRPFWYTAGTLGPYYCNTQFLLGGEAEANALLGMIDAEENSPELPGKITECVIKAYERNACYRQIADYIADHIRASLDIDDIDFISGGARRDWFFSFITAKIFNKRHMTIYKDLGMVISDTQPSGRGDRVFAVKDGSLAGKRCLHVSDLVTEASSYVRAWSPALVKAGTRIFASLTVLDRMQGGGAVLEGLGIRHLALAGFDAGLFDRALAEGYINQRQHTVVLEYIADPNGAMRRFLAEHPDFIRSELAAGGKNAERARMCVESGVYAEGR